MVRTLEERFPIGSKVIYNKSRPNFYSFIGSKGTVTKHQLGDVYVVIDGQWGVEYPCFPDELTLVDSVDENGQYSMDFW